MSEQTLKFPLKIQNVDLDWIQQCMNSMLGETTEELHEKFFQLIRTSPGTFFLHNIMKNVDPKDPSDYIVGMLSGIALTAASTSEEKEVVSRVMKICNIIGTARTAR